MAKNRRPPSRVRYEKANPTISARIPVGYKDRLRSMLEKSGLSFSEWLRSVIDENESTLVDVEKSYQRGARHGYIAGTAETMLGMELSDHHQKAWRRACRGGTFDPEMWANFVMDDAGGKERVEDLCGRRS